MGKKYYITDCLYIKTNSLSGVNINQHLKHIIYLLSSTFAKKIVFIHISFDKPFEPRG